MDPINYMATFTDPSKSFASGFAMGNSILSNQIARDKMAAEQAARDAAAKRAEELKAIMDKLQQPGATYEDYMKASMLLPKDQAEAVQKAATAMKEDERKAALVDTSQIFSAFRGGSPEIAAELLRKQGEAERAAGNEKGANYANMLADMALKNPEGAKAVENLLGYQLAAMPGGKDAFDAIDKMETERRTATEFPELQKKKAEELKQAKSKTEIDAITAKYADLMAQADLDLKNAQAAKYWADAFKQDLENKRPAGAKLDDASKKLMNDSVTAAMKADLVSKQASDLAAAIEKSQPKGGWTAQAWEQAKKAAGIGDGITALRQEYIRLRNTEALRNLPPGPASDKDIEVAMSAFPEDTSNPALIASFLRGMSKLQTYTAEVEKARAQWLNANGSLGPATADLTFDGKAIPKGTPFWEFTKDNISIPNVVGGAPTAKPAQETVVTGGK